MTLRTPLLLPTVAAFVLAASALHAATPHCSDTAGWNTGRLGKPAEAACSAEGYIEAFRLGEALADLHARHAALETRIAATPDEAGVLRRQQRQIDVDIEAIRGVATLRGWPIDTPSEQPE
ncbi:hypothetical protein OS187_12365 [Xanthomonadaceae bacterium JHOS43]|nr:hypothetical protein [Xanthomonadaceae bacterium JHOS43]MCX7564477.1 hypothetical protein [Xanthomonadaceae bacterium XH05]